MQRWTDQDVFLVSDRAYSLASQGRYREAAILFEGLMEVAPENRYCVQALAACRAALGDTDGVLRILDSAVRRWPDDQELRARHCEALLDAGEVERARSEYARLGNRADSARGRRLRLRLEVAK